MDSQGLFQAVTTGTYRSSLYEKYYAIETKADGPVLFRSSYSYPDIYDEAFNLIGKMDSNIVYLKSGKYHFHTQFGSPRNAEVSIYLPGDESFNSLQAVTQGSYEVSGYTNFNSITTYQSGHIFISATGDSATYKIYDKQLNLVTDGYGSSGPLYLEAGEYVLYTTFNGSNKGLSVDIPDHLLYDTTDSGAENSPVDENGNAVDITQNTVENIALIYEAALNRQPDESGLNYWIGVAQQGQSTIDISGFFIQSDEFLTNFGAPSNNDFIDRMYLNVLDRNADAAGKTYWLDQMATGLTQVEVLNYFAVSQENIDNAVWLSGLAETDSGWVI
ncbi:MAG: DUF4214 domain-containing protein [Vreelandella alkaliphila]|uniref:DUF4214 domain-containing protein n=1 Tax=Halomonadaceae TaxID=28256 RepID=UPI000E8A2CA7|nr:MULTISPECIES: DUF4214 domain-containing protein [unclassified Halomonas]HBP40836.1 hypothetical protein [Halomonas sp.]HBS81534.1 hypothetical protein [Halomonas campaniensis]